MFFYILREKRFSANLITEDILWLADYFGVEPEVFKPLTAMLIYGLNDYVVQEQIRDKNAMETFVSDWLAEQNANSQEGLTYVIAQPITYDEVLIDAPYCANLQDVQNAFVKHAALDIA